MSLMFNGLYELHIKIKYLFRVQTSTTTHVLQALPHPWQGGCQCSLQLLIQPCICAPDTHCSWVHRGSVGYKVCPTLLHMTSTGNRTLYLLILSLMPCTLGRVLLITAYFLFHTCHYSIGSKWIGPLLQLQLAQTLLAFSEF